MGKYGQLRALLAALALSSACAEPDDCEQRRPVIDFEWRDATRESVLEYEREFCPLEDGTWKAESVEVYVDSEEAVWNSVKAGNVVGRGDIVEVWFEVAPVDTCEAAVFSSHHRSGPSGVDSDGDIEFPASPQPRWLVISMTPYADCPGTYRFELGSYQFGFDVD